MYFVNILFCLIFLTINESIKGDYIAAVLEYEPLSETNPNGTVESNLEEYVRYIEQAKVQQADIIVFPEYGLTGRTDNPDGFAIEIPEASEAVSYNNYWLQKLANAAIASNIYIVVNLLEKAKNNKNETIYYNSNIVFDKSGRLKAKYRKINLYEEPRLQPGTPEENQITFTTEFGATFGTFIGYDMSFYNPSKTILNKNITDVVYTTSWYSYLPFFHSLSIHPGYALTNRVNVLSANINGIAEGSGGSGIFGSDGTIYTHYISGTHGSKLLYANVKTSPNSSRNLKGFNSFDNNDLSTLLSGYKAPRFFPTDNYEARRLDLSKGNLNGEEVCYNSFCCKFSANISSTVLNTSEIFQLMAFRGRLNVGEQRNFKICALLACENEAFSSCAVKTVNPVTRFDSIAVENEETEENEIFFSPTALKTDLTPLEKAVFNSSVVGSKRITKYVVSNYDGAQNIISFGILANNGILFSSNLFLILITFFIVL